MTPSTEEVLRIAQQISPLLADKGNDIQGAVLAELLSVWLGGHRPDLRDKLLEMHVRAVKSLTTLNDQWAR